MNRCSLAILALCLILAALSSWHLDWNCLVVALVGIAAVMAPVRATGNRDAGYDERLAFIALFPLSILIVLFAIEPGMDPSYYYPMTIAVQAGAAMVFGLLFAVYLNARRAVSLPRRWMVLFATIFACSFSVLYMFSTIYWMASTGFPLVNEDFTNTLENNVVNMMLMLPLAVTVFATMVYAVAMNLYLKRADSLQLDGFRGGA